MVLDAARPRGAGVPDAVAETRREPDSRRGAGCRRRLRRQVRDVSGGSRGRRGLLASAPPGQMDRGPARALFARQSRSAISTGTSKSHSMAKAAYSACAASSSTTKAPIRRRASTCPTTPRPACPGPISLPAYRSAGHGGRDQQGRRPCRCAAPAIRKPPSPWSACSTGSRASSASTAPRCGGAISCRRRRCPMSRRLRRAPARRSRYDSGDFPRCLDMALEAIDYAGFAERQRRAREQGRYLGIGIGNGVKGTGRGPFESGIVRIGRSGRISVYTGAMPMGQGIKTALAQICAEQFAVAADSVTVVAGDTAVIPLRPGRLRQPADRHCRLVGASRGARGAGEGAQRGGASARDRASRISNCAMAASRSSARLAAAFRCAKSRKRSPACPATRCRENSSLGLRVCQSFLPNALTYGMGCHAVEVEVDVETGRVRILRYVVVNDSGRLINPDDRRRPARRRRRARHRQCALRMDGLRRRRPAADHDIRRLSAADRDGSAEDRGPLSANPLRRSIRSASKASANPAACRPPAPSSRRSKTRCRRSA